MKTAPFALIAALLVASIAVPAAAKDPKLPRGEHLDRVLRLDPAALPADASVAVKVVMDQVPDQKGVTAAEAVAWLEGSLRFELDKAGVVVIEKDADLAAAAPPLTLVVTLVEFTPGSSGGRVFAGEFGMGAAKLEVMGVLTRADGTELLRFTDRRSNTGAAGFKDIGGDAGPHLIRQSCSELAADVAAELVALRSAAPPPRKRR